MPILCILLFLVNLDVFFEEHRSKRSYFLFFRKVSSIISNFANAVFLFNLVKFVGNYGSIIILQDSVINQMIGQLIVRGVITEIVSTIFDSIFLDIPSKTSDYYHLRKI